MTQEIKKRRIVIASVLKPVDDTRMFEKIGKSLAENYEVHIIGYATTDVVRSEHIFIHPLPSFPRLSLQRMLIPWKIFAQLLRIKPELLIITTHELLVVGWLYHLLCKKPLFYDVQENYYRNIRYSDTYPSLIRYLLAHYVSVKEKIIAPAISTFLLAEKAYAQEMKFPIGKTLVLENKIKRTDAKPRVRDFHHDDIHFLFSGTLAESTGVFSAIALFKKIRAAGYPVRLTIIGYCSRQSELRRLKNMIAEDTSITLIGGDVLVPHAIIRESIYAADVGIVAYLPNPSTENLFPTKLFEYLGNHLPILMVNQSVWMPVCNLYHAALYLDLSTSKSDIVHHLMDDLKTTSFYTSSPLHIYWEEEVIRLLDTVKAVLSFEPKGRQG